MLSDFQKYVLEEIEETGEYTFILLIPYFLEIEKGIELITNEGGIGKHPENYRINDSDFMILKNQVVNLFSECNLGMYENKEKIDKILNNKEEWIYKQGAPGYFIAEKD